MFVDTGCRDCWCLCWRISGDPSYGTQGLLLSTLGSLLCNPTIPLLLSCLSSLLWLPFSYVMELIFSL